MVRYMTSKTILFAEDQLDFLAVNKLFLERHGYRVVAAEDGEQAELKAMMEAAGFARCDYRNLSGGIVAIHTGYRI